MNGAGSADYFGLSLALSIITWPKSGSVQIMSDRRVLNPCSIHRNPVPNHPANPAPNPGLDCDWTRARDRGPVPWLIDDNLR